MLAAAVLIVIAPEPRDAAEARRFGLAKAAIKNKNRTGQNFLDALLAVLAGNAIYYLLMPHLPAIVRHRLFREDWGLLVDFGICTVIFVLVKYARRGDRQLS
jgi:hypothetical protein